MKNIISLLLATAILWWMGPGTSFAQSSEGGGAVKENLDLPFDAIGESEDEEEAPEIIVFYGEQYEGDGFFFCCDRSSSMAGEQWSKLQKEVVKDINQFSEKVQFSVVFFDANMIKFPTSGRPADANSALKSAAIAMVMSTQTGQGTCSKPALLQSLNFANQSTAKRKQIIFLSDGRQTCNGQDETTYEKALLGEVSARNTQRVHINSILIGTDWIDENFMRQLAAANNGKYKRIQ